MREEYIYIIIQEDEILYVGQTRDLSNRVLSHERRWPDAEIYPVPLAEVRLAYDTSPDMGMNELEGLAIALLDPSENNMGPDLNSVYPWPPQTRQQSPRRKRALEHIAALKSHSR